jgi:hypothetical protein
MGGVYRPAGQPGRDGLIGRWASAWGGTAALHSAVLVFLCASLLWFPPLLPPAPPPFVWIVDPPPPPPPPPPEKEQPHFHAPEPAAIVTDPPVKPPAEITLHLDSARSCEALREALAGEGGALGFAAKDDPELAVLVNPASGQRLNDDSVTRLNRFSFEVACDAGWLKGLRETLNVPSELRAYALFPEDLEPKVLTAVKTFAKENHKGDVLVSATITFDASAPWFQVLDVVPYVN